MSGPKIILEYKSCRPGAPLHEFAGVSDGVDENKERVPETGAGEHADEVQLPVLTDVIDHYTRVPQLYY